MQAECSSEILVSTHKITECHIQEQICAIFSGVLIMKSVLAMGYTVPLSQGKRVLLGLDGLKGEADLHLHVG